MQIIRKVFLGYIALAFHIELRIIKTGIPTYNSEIKSLMKECVHFVWDYWDGSRSGIADFQGVPHYFECEWDDLNDDYAETYLIRKLDDAILALARESESIWVSWQTAFYDGNKSHDSHPAIVGNNPRFLEIKETIEALLKDCEIVVKATPEFCVIKGQDNLPKGMLRKMKVTWREITKFK